MKSEDEIKLALRAAYERERARLLSCTYEGELDRPVFGEGPLHPWLVLIGEAPGGEEVSAGRPFVGKAGRQLTELLAMSGIPRKDVYITNAVKYRPITKRERSVRNRTPQKDEILAAQALLKEELSLLRPSCIATLGNVPLRSVQDICGEKAVTIGLAHGQKSDMRLEGLKWVLFPMYHPASVIYNRALLPVCEQDTKNLGKLYALHTRCEQSVT